MKQILCSIHVFTLNYGIQNNYKCVISRSRIIYLLGNFCICFWQVKFVRMKQILIKFNISEFHEKLSILFKCHMSTNHYHKYTLREVVNAFIHASR